MDKQEKLKQAFNDPKIGIMGADKIYDQVKQNGITKREIKEFMKNQEVNQILKPATRPK